MERCNQSVLDTLRKIKLAENVDRRWMLVTQVERVINGRYHQARRMTPYEAFHGSMQVHRQLVNWQSRLMKLQNEGRRVVVEPLKLPRGDKVLV